jgi:flavin reductase (DIM6/NTAB) family NADH-FMN oxidoreductase RutF
MISKVLRGRFAAEKSFARFSTTCTGNTTNPFVLKSRHGDFKEAESKRPEFHSQAPVTVSKVPSPDWRYGGGANDKSGMGKDHVEIDPFEEGRPMMSNYKLLISGIPRPISFLSTVSRDGASNLAPFSYFQVVDHDPPIFVIGFSARAQRPKDSLKNLRDTGECVINVVTEHMIEAVNATSVDVPYEVSEWPLSGLHSAPSATVKPSRVNEAIFSIEGKLLEIKELDFHGKGREGKPTGSLAIIEATRFWVREDALNKERSEIDLGVLRPLTQLGGISYGRVRETFELPRPSFAGEMEKEESDLRKFLPRTQGISSKDER